MTKKECEKALETLNYVGDYKDGTPYLLENTEPLAYGVIRQLIKEHFELLEVLIDCGFGELTPKGLKVVIEAGQYSSKKLNELRNPQPYKFEELKKGMWVWMVWFKEGAEKGKFAKILNTYTIPPYYHNDEDGEEHERVEFRIGDGSGAIDFDAWKFYPPTKAMEYQE